MAKTIHLLKNALKSFTHSSSDTQVSKGGVDEKVEKVFQSKLQDLIRGVNTSLKGGYSRLKDIDQFYLYNEIIKQTTDYTDDPDIPKKARGYFQQLTDKLNEMFRKNSQKNMAQNFRDLRDTLQDEKVASQMRMNRRGKC